MMLSNEDILMFLYENLYPNIKSKKQKDLTQMSFKFEVAIPK